jgi:hypothetical protein
VFVRGFDFGTTDEQLLAHMSSVGSIVDAIFVDRGSAELTYSTPYEAAAAVNQLQGSIIYGNSRFIDVRYAKDDEGGGAKSAGGKSMGKYGGGGVPWGFMQPAFHPTFQSASAYLPSYMPTLQPTSAYFPPTRAFQQSVGVKGGYGGKGGGGGGGNTPPWQKSNDDDGNDPVGSGRVFVRGFDFTTTPEEFIGHMSQAGVIHKVHWVDKGSATVVYKKKASAVQAASQLNQSTIDGNRRYIDVVLKSLE